MGEYFKFSPIKNIKLIEERDISFEEVISAIENDLLLDIVEYSNIDKYAHQKIFIVEIKNYIYLVPFLIEADGSFFLKQ